MPNESNYLCGKDSKMVELTGNKLIKNLDAKTVELFVYTLCASFFLASLTASILGVFLIPEQVVVKPKGMREGSPLNGGFIDQRVTLSPQDLKQLYMRNIFNSEAPAIEEEGTVDNSNAQDLVKSDLPLKLLGTIFASDPGLGIAIVENTSKKSVNSFMVGDVILEGAIVREILRERVIFDRNGRREYIEVEKKELSRSRRQAGQAKTPSLGLSPLASKAPPNSFKEEGFERSGSSIVMSETYKQRLLTADFAKVLQDAKASPNYVEGELRGFKLNRIRSDSIYEKAGLQNNDVVEEVNGVPLRDTAQAIRLLNSLRSANEIEVRVNRGGSSLSLNLEIR